MCKLKLINDILGYLLITFQWEQTFTAAQLFKNYHSSMTFKTLALK